MYVPGIVPPLPPPPLRQTARIPGNAQGQRGAKVGGWVSERVGAWRRQRTLESGRGKEREREQAGGWGWGRAKGRGVRGWYQAARPPPFPLHTLLRHHSPLLTGCGLVEVLVCARVVPKHTDPVPALHEPRKQSSSVRVIPLDFVGRTARTMMACRLSLRCTPMGIGCTRGEPHETGLPFIAPLLGALCTSLSDRAARCRVTRYAREHLP